VRALKGRANLCTASGPRGLELEAGEVVKAEALWAKELQLQLTKDKVFESWKKRFGIFINPEGLWRCGGRLANADPHDPHDPTKRWHLWKKEVVELRRCLLSIGPPLSK